MVLEEYYFVGGPVDVVTRLVEAPTFSEDAPSGEEEAVQSASVFEGLLHENATAYWEGSFDAPVMVSGDLIVTLYAGAPANAPAEVVVYANGERVGAGETNFLVDVGSYDPHEQTVVVSVQGPISVTDLRIEVQAGGSFVTSLIYYGAESVPSGFALPTIVPCEPGDELTIPSCM